VLQTHITKTLFTTLSIMLVHYNMTSLFV